MSTTHLIPLAAFSAGLSSDEVEAEEALIRVSA
jgi:hypothetical protein